MVELAAAAEPLPRGHWAYSNTNFVLVALLAERATGLSVGQLVARHVAEPLGLRSLRLGREAMPSDARAFVPGDNPFLPADGSAFVETTELAAGLGFGADGFAATAADVARFLVALFGGRLLDEQHLGEMTTTVPADGVRATRTGWASPR